MGTRRYLIGLKFEEKTLEFQKIEAFKRRLHIRPSALRPYHTTLLPPLDLGPREFEKIIPVVAEEIVTHLLQYRFERGVEFDQLEVTTRAKKSLFLKANTPIDLEFCQEGLDDFLLESLPVYRRRFAKRADRKKLLLPIGRFSHITHLEAALAIAKDYFVFPLLLKPSSIDLWSKGPTGWQFLSELFCFKSSADDRGEFNWAH